MQRLITLVILAALFLVACGNDYKLQPLANDAVIVAFGDSLTYGTGASKATSYPSVLADLTGLRVINEGVAGEQTAQGLARLPSVLAEYQPDLVILCHSGNDILRRKSKDQARQNLEAMIDLIEASGAQVLLLGVPDFGLFLSAADFINKAAENTKVAYIQDLLPDLQGNKSIKSDTVHFNADGYAQLAQGIHQSLQDFGGL
jgi:lysophospholipase L1-like esterase